MKFFEQNGWFHPSEFLRAATALHHASPLVFMDAQRWDCKYIQIYVDQRTKSFIFRTGDGKMLARHEVYAMFPELRDPGEQQDSHAAIQADSRA